MSWTRLSNFHFQFQVTLTKGNTILNACVFHNKHFSNVFWALYMKKPMWPIITHEVGEFPPLLARGTTVRVTQAWVCGTTKAFGLFLTPKIRL